MSTQKSFWSEDEVRFEKSKPILMDIQTSLLERGLEPYRNGARRVLWQAPCGSGKTVVAAQQTVNALAKNKTVLHVVHRRRLVDQMIGMLDKFSVGASPIMEGRSGWNARVKCASRDTLLAMLKDGQPLPTADLIIWDEAHTAAREVQAWYLQFLPSAYWTGYTATPIGPEGKSLNPPYQALVCMAPTSALMAIGRLCPIKVYDPKALEGRRKRGDKVKPVGDPVAHWWKYADGLPTVVFASNLRSSKEIVEQYRSAGVTAEHIDASTPEDEREEVFERSRKGETKIISNVGVLVEGVDLPWLVVCQMLRGCNSLVLWCQGNGRIMRAFPGKTHGICLDHAGAVYDFGPPDRDYVWTLDDEAGNCRGNKQPKNEQSVACQACGFVFSGKPACPECGKMLPRKVRQSMAEPKAPGDGVLTEFNGEQSAGIAADKLDRYWTKCLHIGKAKGWTMGRVLGMFKQKSKLLPWEAGLSSPLPRGKEGWKLSAEEWLERIREAS